MPHRNLLRRVIAAILSLLFPERCFACGALMHFGRGLCPDCYRKANFITDPMCRYCGAPFEFERSSRPVCSDCLKSKPPYSRCIAVMRYDNIARKIILPLKHGDKTYIAKWMAEMIFGAAREILNETDIIVPVPIHMSRLLKRLYNQTALIARPLGRFSGKPVSYNNLVRTKATKSQGHMNRLDRLLNVGSSFSVKNPAEFAKKSVLIVDDVTASGATLAEIARTLKAAGAKRVLCVTFAKVLV